MLNPVANEIYRRFGRPERRPESGPMLPPSGRHTASPVALLPIPLPRHQPPQPPVRDGEHGEVYVVQGAEF